MFSCESARFDATKLSASAAQLRVRFKEHHQTFLMGLFLQLLQAELPLPQKSFSIRMQS